MPALKRGAPDEAAGAPAGAPEAARAPLYPPKDRLSRSILDALSRFKRSAPRKSAEHHTIRLTVARTGYGRAVAHEYATRLGLLHETEHLEGQYPVVIVRLTEADVLAAASTRASSARAGGGGAGSGGAGADADGGGEGGAPSVRATKKARSRELKQFDPAAAAAALSAAADPAPSAAARTPASAPAATLAARASGGGAGKQSAARSLSQELNLCAKRASELVADGAEPAAVSATVEAALAVFERMQAAARSAAGAAGASAAQAGASGVPAQSCAVLVHLCLSVGMPSAAVRVFEYCLAPAAHDAPTDAAAGAAAAPAAAPSAAAPTDATGGAAAAAAGSGGGLQAPAILAGAGGTVEAERPALVAAAARAAAAGARAAGKGGGGGGGGGELRDEPSFSGAVRAYSELGLLAAASRAIALMDALGIKQRVRTFAPLAAAHARASRAHAARGGYGEARRALAAAMALLPRLTAPGLEPAPPDLLPLALAAGDAGEWASLVTVCHTLRARFCALPRAALDGLEAALRAVGPAAAAAARSGAGAGDGPPPPRLRVFHARAAADGVLRRMRDAPGDVTGDAAGDAAAGDSDSDGDGGAGVCRLRAVDLTDGEWSALAAGADALIRQRRGAFAAFAAWLSAQPPFEFLIDAANVGYYGNNYAGAQGEAATRGGGLLRFEPIVAMVEAVVAHARRAREAEAAAAGGGGGLDGSGDGDGGGRCLVLLHEKYLRRAADEAPAAAAYLSELRSRGWLYATPHGANDDHYWLYAALNGNGARRTLVVSNDLMRDHVCDMHSALAQRAARAAEPRPAEGAAAAAVAAAPAVAEPPAPTPSVPVDVPRSFARWKARHVIGYDLKVRAGAGLSGEAAVGRVQLRPPAAYSSAVQAAADGGWFFPAELGGAVAASSGADGGSGEAAGAEVAGAEAAGGEAARLWLCAVPRR